MPYLPGEEGIVAKLIADMNAADLAFVVHVGDIKASWTPCTDALYAERRALFAQSAHPMIVLPGDNDWLDCVTALAGGHDPRERLAMFRRVLLAPGSATGGAGLALERQSEARFAEYAEHLRWRQGDVLFVAVNVTGSNNNLGYSEAGDREHARRAAAVAAWLDQSFAAARRERLRGVVVFMQANPGFFGKPRLPNRQDGFAGVRAQLALLARGFGGPVLLVHGDTHRHRVDRPLVDLQTGAPVPNLTRVEVFGTPQLGWVKVTVDPASADLFEVVPVPYRSPEQ
ncbi:MAG: hypothetical protein MUF56_09335 [Solirubrobacteraceae bacterium]|nr:hypothetical protein [Solirubrobacteraceae bacterium]